MPVQSASSLPGIRSRYLPAGDVRIHVAELPGAGPPMLLLHGIGMDWRVWQAVSRRLHPYFHLYLPDLRGHGSSDKPERGYTLAHYAADVEDVIDALNLERVVLVGSSLGAMVALSVEAPVDLVPARILVDPPLTGGPIPDRRQFVDILRLKHKPVPRLADYLADLNPGLGRFLVTTMSEMWHEAADGVIQEMLDHPDEYYADDDALRADASPTLVMQADPERGSVLSDRDAERALALLPQGSFVRVAGAGHAIHATRPAEFVQLIRDFVARAET